MKYISNVGHSLLDLGEVNYITGKIIKFDTDMN